MILRVLLNQKRQQSLIAEQHPEKVLEAPLNDVFLVQRLKVALQLVAVRSKLR